MPWGRSPAKQYLALVTSSKTDTSVPKVGHLFVRNNLKGAHLHEKPFHTIITNSLSKPINKGGEEGKGIWTFLGEMSERERKLTWESLGDCQKGRRIVFLGTSRCRIPIPTQQQIDCEHNLVNNPLT